MHRKFLNQLFCFSHLKVVILPQDISKRYPRFSLNLLIQKLHPFAPQSYQFLGLIKQLNISPTYSKTKQDIKNLRKVLVVTHIRSNHANFQRCWPIGKGAESFKIRPPTVHSNFTVDPLHNKICQS